MPEHVSVASERSDPAAAEFVASPTCPPVVACRPRRSRHRQHAALRNAAIRIGALLLTLVAAGCAGGPSLQPNNAASSASSPTARGQAVSEAAGLQDAFIAVVDRVRSSVVQLQTESGLGSGIVFDGKGDIVTNNHVVAGATTIEITTAEGKRYSGALLGSFPAGDLAVVRAPGANLKLAAFADSDALKVGTIVLAVGNPLGLQSSVTDGIVSGIDRTVSEGGGITLPDTIQTSAAINPGNSGGALVDLSGQVVGIPTLAAADPTLGTAAGIGFAIPSNTVTDIASQIIANGRVVNTHRAYLGIRTGTAVDGTNTPIGVVVTVVVAGGPADRAGIAAGDLIIAVGGKQVRTTTDLAVALADLMPGGSTPVTVITPGGVHHTVTVAIAEIPAP
jgi:putative serine protease PepD